MNTCNLVGVPEDWTVGDDGSAPRFAARFHQGAAPPLHCPSPQPAGRSPFRRRPAAKTFNSHVGVTGAEHGGEPGRFFFAAAAFARLFKMPVAAHDLERALAIDLLLQSP